MARALSLCALSVGVLAQTGCSSTLDEFRCTSNEQCNRGENSGLCHSSGYCAYLDEEVCDGLRFGDHSGEVSNQCVDDANLPDAGSGPSPDATLRPPDGSPVANIASVSLGCERTQVNLDGTSSVAFDGATLTKFEWTLRSPTGDLIQRLEGAPSDNFERGSILVNGTLDEPRINLTPYMDNEGLHIVTNGLQADIFQDSLTLNNGNRVLFFTIGSVGDITQPINISIEGTDDSAALTSVLNTTKMITPDLIAQRIEFTIPEDLTAGVLKFDIAEGDFWIDNVGIDRQGPNGSSAEAILDNRNFEQNSVPWQFTLASPTGTALTGNMPTSMMKYGDYQLELIVTDSNDKVSMPVSTEIRHRRCDDDD